MLQADIQNTIHNLGKNIQEVERPSTFIEHNSHLENCLGVQKIVPEKIRQLFAKKSEYHFSIPVKTEE
ncbi:restriction endonuclease PLD domain-containing protein, partial [Neisseria sp. P0015.S009]